MSAEPVPSYLTRLVTRMTDEPAIRPRMASRFEGNSSRLDLEVAADGPGVGSTIGAARDMPPERAVMPPRFAGPDRAGDASPAAAPRDDLARLVERLTAGNPSVAANPVASQADPEARGEPVDVASRPAPLHPTAGATPEDGPRAAEAIRAVAPMPSVPIDRQTPPPRRPFRSIARRSIAGDDTGRDDRRQPDVVEVHIGRIEVRAIGAIPASPAPVRPAAGPRPLSLERYLAGERRS